MSASSSSKVRLQETADFLRDFLGRLECIASTSKGKSCPAGLATGSGTGFNLVTDHHPGVHQARHLRA